MDKSTNPLDVLMQGIAAGSKAPQSTEQAPEAIESDEEQSLEPSEEPEPDPDGGQEEPETPEPAPQPTNEEIADWDLEEEEQGQEQPTTDVYKEIGTLLGMPLKDKSLVIEEIKKLKTDKESIAQALEAAKSQNPFANDHLSKANEIAKNNGDYLSYLKISSVDYNAIPDDTLIAHAYAQEFENEENPEEAFGDFLSTKSAVEKRILANQIRKSFIKEQQDSQRKIEQDVINKKKTLDEGLTKHLETMDNLFGFKLKPSHKKEIYTDIESGKLVNDILYKADGSHNFKEMAEIAFLRKHKDKIFEYLKSKTTNEVKRDEFRKISNVEVTKKPNGVQQPKAQTGVEKYLQELKAKKQ